MALDEAKLRKLVAIDPADPLSRFALGRKLAESPDTRAEAVDHLRFSNEQAADHLATYHVLGQALLDLGRRDEARAVLTAGYARASQVNEGMGRDLGPAMAAMLADLGG